MEMRQCEYRAVIPSALACNSSSFFGSVFGLVFDIVVWVVKAGVYLIIVLLIALAISAFTGYGSRYISNLPEVIFAAHTLQHVFHHFCSPCEPCMASCPARSLSATASRAMVFDELLQHNADS